MGAIMVAAGDGGQLTSDERGQSSPLGYIIVITMILVGTTTVVALGTGALADTRGQSELQRAEHSMTLFDSRAAMVGLGDSSAQSIDFGHDSGSFETNPEQGQLTIKHVNYTNGETETVYDETLGTISYENGDTTLAYQGGGVWRQDESGASRMVSPPEFHYRQQTLTLPIMRVFGEGHVSGTAAATLRERSQPRLVFPNATTGSANTTGAPYNFTEDPYTNPVENGNVYVWVQSEYYTGWANYFRERTSGNVTVYDHNETVKLELLTLGGPPGEFTVPDAGDDVGAGGIGDGHPIDEFDVSLETEKKDGHFAFYTVEGGEEYETHVYYDLDNNPNTCSPGDPQDGDIHLSTYYYDGEGSQEYESFEMASMEQISTLSDVSVSCGSSDSQLEIDLVSDDIDLTYDEIGSDGTYDPGIDDPNSGGATGTTRGNKFAFGDRIEDSTWELRDTAVWDQHEPAVSWEGAGRTYDEGTGATETQKNVTNHYLSLIGPDVDLIAKHGPASSTPIDTDGSTGTLQYDTSESAEYITYLHVTENEIDVEFD